MAVQDQDGLGTCYANQTALLIQNTLNLPNPVSYQHLALSTSSRSSTYKTGETLLTGNKKLISEGGSSCQAFEAAQISGFCSTQNFGSLEHSGADPLHTQEHLLKALAFFLDKNAGKNSSLNEKDWKNVESHLLSLFIIRDNQCEQKKAGDKFAIARDQFPRRAKGALIEKLLNFINADCKKNICTVKGLKDKEGKQIKITVEQKNQWIKSLRQIRDEMAPYSTPQNGVQIPQRQFKDEFIYKGNETGYYPFTLTLIDKLKESPGLSLPSEPTLNIILFQPLRDQEIIIKRIDENCGEMSSIADMLELTDLRQAAKNPLTCSASYDMADPKFAQLNDAVKDIVQFMRPKNNNKVPNKISALLKLIAPGCEKELEKNAGFLGNKVCREVQLTNKFNPASEYSSSLADTYKEPEKRFQAATELVQKSLCEGKVVGIDVCFDIISSTRDPLSTPIDTNFCEKSTSGFHAMTVVGKRNLEGFGNQFLVQNSYGISCNGTIDVDPDPKELDYECEKNENGDFTGRFWIAEDILLMNSISLNIIDDYKP